MKRLLAILAALCIPILSLAQSRTFMTYEGAWSSGYIYTINDSASYLGTVYISTVTGNVNNVPSSSPSAWTPLGSSGAIFGATIDNSVIGGISPSSGSFTSLASSGTTSLSALGVSGVATFNGSTIFNSPQLLQCFSATSAPLIGFNSTSTPANYNIGFGSLCDGTLEVYSTRTDGAVANFSQYGLNMLSDTSIEFLNAANNDHVGLKYAGYITNTLMTDYAGSQGGGQIMTGEFISGGGTFTASGCSNSTLVGGGSAGSYKSGTTGTCTVTVTMGQVGHSFNGWSCSVWDITTNTDIQKETAFTSTTVTFSGTTVSGDVITFSCIGY
jgi:hypothetical protein